MLPFCGYRITVGKHNCGKIRYYLWLLIILRFLVPFSFQGSLVNHLFSQVSSMTDGGRFFLVQTDLEEGETFFSDARVIVGENVILPYDYTKSTSGRGLGILKDLKDNFFLIIGIVWLVIASVFFIRRITTYQNFVKYIQAGWRRVDDPDILDQLGDICETLGVIKPIDLCTNSIIASPLLLGIRRPTIVLPEIPKDQKDLYFILMHEMVHYQRKDMLFIWLTQVVVSLHWFNPLVYFMARQIEKDRELSCDEGVLEYVGADQKRQYGYTLLNAFSREGDYRERYTATALFESKDALYERLEAIDQYQGKSGIRWVNLTGIAASFLLVSVVLGSYIPINPQVKGSLAQGQPDDGRVESSAHKLPSGENRKAVPSSSAEVKSTESSKELAHKRIRSRIPNHAGDVVIE